ncbi:UNVERIFIED_CONTAM: hypothetical protein GTU68_037422 [Idotea baltica]|nr:hypothetical protein [Idotea baltica]
MDRDNRWERVQQAHGAITEANGLAADTAEQAVADAYDRGESDEFFQPTVIGDYAGMNSGDGLFMVNFRSDRAREILDALAGPDFDAFARARPDFAAILGMVEYSSSHNIWMKVMFPSEEIAMTLGETVSKAGLTQFRLAETEKYPHVTFFLNGGAEQPLPGEARHMEPSPKVATYDLQPEMSARGVTDVLVEVIENGAHDLIVVNFANPDMVGHSGDLGAAIKAVETVDTCLGEVVEAMNDAGGAMIVTADHGNCEMMIHLTRQTGRTAPTAHTTLQRPPVPRSLAGWV